MRKKRKNYQLIDDYDNYIFEGQFDSFVITDKDKNELGCEHFIRGELYIIDMVCSHGVKAKINNKEVDLSGLILKRWTNVKFSGKGIKQNNIHIYGENVHFSFSKKNGNEYLGNEI